VDRRATTFKKVIASIEAESNKLMNVNAQDLINASESELAFDTSGRVRWHSVSNGQRELIVPEPRISATDIRAFILASTEPEAGYDIGVMPDEEAWHYSVTDAALADWATTALAPSDDLGESPFTGAAEQSSAALVAASTAADTGIFNLEAMQQRRDDALSHAKNWALSADELRAAYELGEREFQGADLSGAFLWRACVREADFRSAKFEGADLSDADLSGVNFEFADLSGATFERANLGGADLRDSDLRGAKFGDAYLQGAKFKDAKLQGADFEGAILDN